MRQDVPDTSNAAIGERLIAVREARGLNQMALAKAVDVSPQRWGGYERGRTVPPPQLLAKFWQITGATADFVLFGRMDGLPFELAIALQEQGKAANPPPLRGTSR